MITEIEIQNFKSIQHGQIKFEPLTVIIGANSTGKSNLIKALDFISDIASIGLSDAIYKRGGFDEILPKIFTKLTGKEIYFKIQFTLEVPSYWPQEFGDLNGTYELGLAKQRNGKIKIKRESLEIKSVLLLSYFLVNKWNSKNNESKIERNFVKRDYFKNSYFKFNRTLKGKLEYETDILINEESNNLLLNWFGVKKFLFPEKEGKSFSSENEFKKLIIALLNNVRPGVSNSDLPIISLDRALINLSPHLRKIQNELESISRYDLFINELRQEQPISDSNQVSNTGDNIPSVVKKFISEDNEAWQRILSTMTNISPYFAQVHSESLRAGKEYLIFEEIFNGRPIESWEASDGTLRALAIILCLESHKKGSTVMIEEPEHGLHPWAVKDLLSHIKNTINIKDIQVIITTHSQQVLECLELSEVLVTERNELGTTYTRLESILPNSKISKGEIGELWTRGLLKGVPISI